ncbi:MAG TPA: response regulator transcription factor [Polyangiaceae bacterium]|nr:response regulator transcription factor [Polyangiaceae bacterium]
MPETAPPREKSARARILIVEDDANTRTALVRWLEHEYDVIAASDGLEGLEIATTQDPPPDLILADVWMPRVDGVEMVTRIKRIEALRRIPAIFLTGQTSPVSMMAGLSAGARAYLPKPIDLDVLDHKVRSALRRV